MVKTNGSRAGSRTAHTVHGICREHAHRMYKAMANKESRALEQTTKQKPTTPKNFKYDIINQKLELYPTTGKFDFIISSFSKDCGHYKFKDNYKCSIYKLSLIHI